MVRQALANYSVYLWHSCVLTSCYRLYWSTICAVLLSSVRLAYSQPSTTTGTIEYWVRADRGDECPLDKRCVTITDLLNSTAMLTRAHSSVYLYFVPGTYLPNVGGLIHFYGKTSHYRNSLASRLYIIGQIDSCHSQACKVVIDCTRSKIAFAINNVQALEMSNIKLNGCGLDITSKIYVNKKRLRFTSSIFLHNVESATFYEVLISHSSGIGLAAVASHELLFLKMFKSAVTHSNTSPENNSTVGGNILLVLTYRKRGQRLTDVHRVNMTNCTLSHGIGSCTVVGTTDCTSGGLTVKTNPTIKLYILIVGTIFASNSGNRGSAFRVDKLGMPTVFTGIRVENSSFVSNVASNGSIYIDSDIPVSRADYFSRWAFVKFLRCIFAENIANGYGSSLLFKISVLIHRVYKSSTFERLMLLEISHSTFVRNTANHYGTVYLSIATYISSKHAQRANQIIFDNNTFEYNTANIGAALTIDCLTKSIMQPDINDGNIELEYKTEFQICNSKFRLNSAATTGGSIYVRDVSSRFHEVKQYFVNLRANSDYVLYNCIFEKNTASTGSTIMFIIPNHPDALSQLTFPLVAFTIEQSVFSKNKQTSIIPANDRGGSTVYLENLNGAVLRDVRFSDNKCRALHLVMAQVVIEGNVIIENNEAPMSHGAGIYSECLYIPKLTSSPLIVLMKASLLSIVNNHASGYGGGIAIKGGCRATESCLYKNADDLRTGRVIMTGNKAGIAGDSIYGGNLEENRECGRDFWTVFNISQLNTASAVSSPPYKVCICGRDFPEYHSCSHYYYVSIFPGQPFHVPVVGVGSFNYSSPAIIGARINKVVNQTIQMDDWMRTQQVGLECKNLTYMIYAATVNTAFNISVIVENYNLEHSSRPQYVNSIVEIFIKNCPFGFEPRASDGVCKCTSHLSNAGIICDIKNATIERQPRMWIGNFSNDIAVHNRCPFGYCRSDVKSISPYNQQEQCDFDRSGVLCGACRPGLSLVLGTSQCKQCSNLYLLLLIPFALAGITLIVILLKCNLTVSTGTINGLIFYANVLQTNRTAFFPAKLMNTPTYLLFIFIAWLNLDFGKEICFAASLNAHLRTWLQFVFPLYIWTLMVLLILISRHSVKVSQLTGTNTVSVLATMLLLSYTKLLRVIFDSFSATALSTASNTTVNLWTIDGNFLFLGWPHVLLFVFALFMLLIYAVPFTLVVLFSPVLQRYSEAACLKWITCKLNPFMDSFQGPFKIKVRFWTGLLLLARLFMVLVSSANISGEFSMNLLVICIVTCSLLVIWLKAGCIYKKTLPNVIELFFLFNLLLFSVVSLYLRATAVSPSQLEHHSDIAVLCMVGSTFVLFLLILGYHTLFETYYGKKLVGKIKKRCIDFKTNNIEQELDLIPNKPKEPNPHLPTCTVVELHKPLLESTETS